MASQMLLRLAVAGGKQSLRQPSPPTAALIKGAKCRTLKLATSTAARHLSSSSAEVEVQQLHESESFLTGTSSLYAEQMYEQYLDDPNSIHPSWKKYFDNIEEGLPYDEGAFNRPTAAASSVKRAISGVRFFPLVFMLRIQRLLHSHIFLISLLFSHGPYSLKDAAPSDSLGVSHLIRAYQVNGHLGAKLDPLGIHSKETFPFRPCNLMDLSAYGGWPAELTPEYHGFTEADLDRKLNFKGRGSGGNKGYLEELSSAPDKVTLRGILEELRRTYCSTLGVEYMHIGDQDQMNWLRQRIENPRFLQYDKEKKQHIYERLCFADTFENFLAQKFNTTKRFGLDGGEAIIPALKDAIDRASELGAHSFVIGMPHRGRLNVLANVMRKPMPLIFSEFQGTHYDMEDHVKGGDDWGMSGDVKYHLGSSMDRTYPDGRNIHLSLVANPSHLECVNPVVAGKVRAKQYYSGDR